MTTISPQELVKALNEYGVLVQNKPQGNFKLVYRARVHKILGEETIVLESFK